MGDVGGLHQGSSTYREGRAGEGSGGGASTGWWRRRVTLHFRVRLERTAQRPKVEVRPSRTCLHLCSRLPPSATAKDYHGENE